jgi:hypothetical protein
VYRLLLTVCGLIGSFSAVPGCEREREIERKTVVGVICGSFAMTGSQIQEGK